MISCYKLLVLYYLLTNRFYLNKFQVRRYKLVISIIRLVDLTVAAIVGILDLAWLPLYGTYWSSLNNFIYSYPALHLITEFKQFEKNSKILAYFLLFSLKVH